MTWRCLGGGAPVRCENSCLELLAPISDGLLGSSSTQQERPNGLGTLRDAPGHHRRAGTGRVADRRGRTRGFSHGGQPDLGHAIPYSSYAGDSESSRRRSIAAIKGPSYAEAVKNMEMFSVLANLGGGCCGGPVRAGESGQGLRWGTAGDSDRHVAFAAAVHVELLVRKDSTVRILGDALRGVHRGRCVQREHRGWGWRRLSRRPGPGGCRRPGRRKVCRGWWSAALRA